MSEGENGRKCIKWRKKKTVRRIKEKTERMENEPKGVQYITDEEAEKSLSEGEDGRPCIKWRRQRTTNITGSKEKTVENWEETDIGREEKVEAEEYM